MSFAVGTPEFAGVAAAGIEAAWKAPLAVLVGAYAMSKQHKIILDQIALADRQVKLGEQYVGLAKSKYTAMSKPVFNDLNALYKRYASVFAGKEITFLDLSQTPVQYTPYYVPAEGRAMGKAQSSMDEMAEKARRRTSKYAVGKRRWDSHWYQIQAARARTDSADMGYLVEDERMKWFSEFFWHRWTAGANVLEGIAHNAVAGVTNQSIAATNGIRQVGDAFKTIDAGYDMMQGALANQANFWGSIANGAGKYIGNIAGASDANNAMQRMSWAQGTTVHRAG